MIFLKNIKKSHWEGPRKDRVVFYSVRHKVKFEPKWNTFIGASLLKGTCESAFWTKGSSV